MTLDIAIKKADEQGQLAHTFRRLQQIRNQTDLTLRKTKYLKDTFTGFDGEEHPLTIRYYQVQGILHLVVMRRFILGDDTGLGKCQPYNTLVLTDCGLLQMGEIEDWSEMEPNSFRPMSRSVHVLVDGERRSIKNFYYGGVKPTITATTRYGFGNTGSQVHPMLVLRGGRHQWVEARDLNEGDYLCIERREMSFPEQEPRLARGPGPDRMTPSLARFLGYYVGEGSLTSKYQVVVSQCPKVNPEVHADILRLFLENFGREPLRPKVASLYLSDVKLRRWLESLGLGYCRSPDRSVPACILQATKESSREFLRALFEGEGHVSKTHIECSTASEELGRQIQIMLLRFGVVSNRSIKKVKAYPDSTYWRLTICGEDARMFQEHIGFVSTRKCEALRDCLARPRNTNHDVVPEIQWIFEQVRSDLLKATSRSGDNANRTGSGIKQFGVSLVNTLNNIRNYGRNPSYAFIKKVVGLLEEQAPGAESLTLLMAFLNTRYFYDPVVSLEEGEEEVFDIAVADPRHCFTANGFVNHNTVECIGALCYIWEKEPNRKVLILTTKSAVTQWRDEFVKFTMGIKVIVGKGTKKQRDKAREMFEASTGPTALIMGYRSAVQDFTQMQKWRGHIFVADEATAFKNPKTQIHQVCRHLASPDRADRAWGLTATLIKNHLMEGYGIYQVIVPGLFGMTHNQFMMYYCLVRMQRIPRSNRQVPVIVGYTPQRIKEFRGIIDPFFIGRPKHEVASDLPTLTSRTIEFPLTKEQEDKYLEALEGLLEVGEGDGAAVKEVTKLTAITYCQEIVDHLGLIDCEGESAKLNVLLDLLTDGDFTDEKVIIFTRFRKMVDLLMPVLARRKVKAVRITGSENENQRAQAMAKFQDPNDETRVVCITTAGSEAINLQAAKALICFDTPWSAGDFLQLLGRMIRIGSAHDKCYVVHLLGCRQKKHTVDHRVMQVLHKKMELVEAVLGKRIKGEGDEAIIEVRNEISDLFSSLRQDALDAGGKR